MRIAIIINPISGRTGRRDPRGTRRLAEFQQLFARTRGPADEADIVITEGAGHAAELARTYVARGFDAVVARGGDGTMNEVAGPLIGTPVGLGIIPSGSGDGLARSLGLHARPAEALAAVLSGRASAIDVGYLGARHFVNVSGIGFDATIARAFNEGHTRGAMAYVTRGLRAVGSYRPHYYRLRLDADGREGYHLLVAFANGREYGNRLVLAPDADARDGRLDVVIVGNGSPFQHLWRARRLAFGHHLPATGIYRTTIQTASVTGSRMICHVDGESFEADGTLDVRVVPRALRVCGL